LPTLRKAPGCTVVRFDPLGGLAIIRFNQLFPPFDNVRLRQALLPAIDQKEFVTAWVGEQTDLGKYPVGFFTAGSPMANDVRMVALTSPRSLAKARQLVAESGYKGEKVVLMSPSDQPSIEVICQVARDLFQKVGINVD
jgi:peptide/nickel transport system substrate-binding protein